MVNFAHNKTFNGTCAPFIYIAGCSPEARHAYTIESRFWLVATSIGFLALLSATIYRYTKISETFNTLRLVLLLYLAGAPFWIVYDALRGTDIHAHGVPPAVMGLFWWCSSMPSVTAFVVWSVTYVSFASKDLLVRPALTGSPVFFWSLEIPFVLFTIILGVIAGINYWYYFIAMRVLFCFWAAILAILSAFCAFYGKKTLDKLNASGDSFNYNQQLRVLIFIVASGGICGITLAVQAYYLDTIDNFYQIFILCSSMYRLSSLISLIGSTAYVIYAAAHHKKVLSASLQASKTASKVSRSAESHDKVYKHSSSSETSTESEESSGTDDSV